MGMLFTPAERRLLALLVILLGAGYGLTGLAQLGLLPAGWLTVPGAARGAAAPGEPGVAADSVVAVRADASAAPAAGRVTLGAERASPFHDGYLDLNAADSLDLLELPGIGPSLAGRILALRRQRGGFRSIEELRSVRGIGEKRFAGLAELVGLPPACSPQ
jgi:hypothetical protein